MSRVIKRPWQWSVLWKTANHFLAVREKSPGLLTSSVVKKKWLAQVEVNPTTLPRVKREIDIRITVTDADRQDWKSSEVIRFTDFPMRREEAQKGLFFFFNAKWNIFQEIERYFLYIWACRVYLSELIFYNIPSPTLPFNLKGRE